MSGYTPLFDSLTRGTLCGRWPDIGLWPIVLSLSDARGEVDVTQDYIARITGLPEPEVRACMTRFCEPDAHSRSQIDEGRRLVLLDTHRDWGWRIVNHGYYREKARLAAKNAKEVESGKNRDRMAGRIPNDDRPPETAGNRREPPLTDPSNSNSNSNSNKKKKEKDGADAPVEFPEGLDLKAWHEWEVYRRGIKKPLKPPSVRAAMRKLAKFGEDQAAVVEQTIANGWQGLFPVGDRNGGGKSRKTRYDEMMEALGE
jgi:hypothetical protein